MLRKAKSLRISDIYKVNTFILDAEKKKKLNDIIQQEEETWKENCEKLLKEYTIANGEKLESDKTFSSPSTVADFCVVSSNNGWLVWKDKGGQTLDSVYRKQ